MPFRHGISCAGVIALLASGGCGLFYDVPYSEWSSHDQHVKAVARQEDARTETEKTARHNSAALHHYRYYESQYYRVKGSLPRQCLALSGGGIRSAAFSIGVLKALHEKRRLSEIDVISSVSGGSYAASWFYVQQGAPSDLFAEASLSHLGDRADLVSAPPARSAFASVFSWLAYFFKSVADLFYTGQKYTYIDGSIVQGEYEAAIRRTFFSSPGKDGPNPPIDELAPLIAESRLPFLIVNATVGHGEAPAGTFSKRVFEFTPIRVGADSVGYFPPRLPDDYYSTSEDKARAIRKIRLSRVVRISGAALNAVDVQNVLGRSIAELVEVDLGAKVEFEDLGRNAFFYLSDGGFADNLGAYSLIRRLCEEIIVSDAEFDPSYEFGAYRKLNQALREEMHATLSISDIDEVIAKAGNQAIPSLPQPTDVLAPQRPCPAASAFDGTRPVMRGIVRSFPVLEPTGVVDRPIDVIYLKLSLDRKALDNVLAAGTAERGPLEARYSPSVVSWYEARRKINERCPDFPQLSTIHQNFTPVQFRAYVDLGYKMVLNNWNIFDPSQRLSRQRH